MMSTFGGWISRGLSVWVVIGSANLAYGAAPAFDNASDEKYAAEIDGAWKGQNPQPDEENPPGTDNGGEGMLPWNFAGGYHDAAASPYGRLNHFIDGIDFPASAFNNLGSRAWGLTNANRAFFGYTANATRLFASDMLMGETVSAKFDSPAVFSGLGGQQDPAGLIIELVNSAGTTKLGLLAQTGFNANQWGIYGGHNSFTSTLIPEIDTSDGSSFRFTLTGPDSGTLVFDGRTFNIVDLMSDGTGVAGVRFTMYSNGSGDTVSNPNGAREFFFDDIRVASGFTWNVNANGIWSDDANWLGGAPNGAGLTAVFGSAIDAPRTVTLDSAKTVGNLTFDNPNSYTISGTATLSIDNGGIASINVVSGSHTISSPLSIAAGNVVTKSGAGTLTISGPQSHGAGAVLTTAAGTTNLNSDGGVNLSINANATTNFGSSQNLAALNVGPGATATISAGGGKLLAASALAVDPTARLNLSDNDLVVLATPATRSAVLADVSGKVATAFHGALWDQPGITSSAAAGDSAHLTTLGVILNDNGAGQPRYQSFDGQAVDVNSVLVKYTYYGDGDLNGLVDGTDYALIDNGFNFALSGWLNGDFNYDGHIDGTDYAFIDNAFNFQGGPLAAGNGLQAVPEPGSIVLIVIGAIAMLIHIARRPSAV